MSEFAARYQQPETAFENRYVLAGQVLIATRPTRFSTVLGSCVAVCLFDPMKGIGGINHIQMPGKPNRADKEPNRWAVPGTESLIEQLCHAGAGYKNLRAKVFGGASTSTRDVPENLRIGDLNVQSVLGVLQEHRIRIGSSHTGGNTGLKLLFDSHDGSVWVKQLVRKN